MEGRRRITLSDQMKAAGDTSSSSSSSHRNSLASFLNDVVLTTENQKTRNRTLLDVIQEDQPNNNAKDRNSWKAFKDLLRLKRRNSDESTHQQQEEENDVVHERAENSDPTGIFAGGEFSDEDNNEPVAVSMSLMDLLEETEVELDPGSDDGADGYRNLEEEEGGEGGVEVEKGGVESNVVVEYNCCVCMVRHKGAAFIPCGHTFCRMCSRELWVSRRNCPLCNHFILEILDIF